MKFFGKLNPLNFSHSYKYKKNFLNDIHSTNLLKGSTLHEKLKRLYMQEKFSKIILISSEIKNFNKNKDEMKIVSDSSKQIYNLRESNPQLIARRWSQILNHERSHSYKILFMGMFLFSLYYVYNNYDVFFDTSRKSENMKILNYLSFNSDWKERLLKRLESSDKQEKNEFEFKHNLEERIKDVKGIDEVRDEIEEVVKMFKNPKKYEDAGAKLIKGILLVGKPGTGKTLLARALAGESGINFIYTSASEFDQKYVGAGTKKIKNLFKKARENTPCIIFIDEIDSLIDKGRRKGNNSTSDDRAGINTFLAEMDGFKKNEHIFILGATNSLDSLDSAALRPGRFDKVIQVPLPDKTGRKEIFTFYLNKLKLPIFNDITSIKLSEMTPGFTGAEIENMINTATIMAVDRDSKYLDRSTFEEARDRIIMGIKLKQNKNIRYILQRAVHEAGHALVCAKSNLCKKELHKVSIAKRGFNEGKTSILQSDNFSGTKDEFETYISVSLAGIFAEEIYFGNSKLSVGCGSDLSRATSLAKDMVNKYAMNSSDFGYMYIQEGIIVDHKISNETRNKMDLAAQKIISKATENVKDILRENVSELKNIIQHLIEYDELSREDLELILSNKPIDDSNRKGKIREINIDSIAN